MYKLKEKYYGMYVSDSKGKHILGPKTSQRTLKYLYESGHTEKIEKESRPAKPKDSSKRKRGKTKPDSGE